MPLYCQFCDKRVDGRVKFSRGWCCWTCLEKFNLEDDDLTTYFRVVGEPSYEDEEEIVQRAAGWTCWRTEVKITEIPCQGVL